MPRRVDPALCMDMVTVPNHSLVCSWWALGHYTFTSCKRLVWTCSKKTIVVLNWLYNRTLNRDFIPISMDDPPRRRNTILYGLFFIIIIFYSSPVLSAMYMRRIKVLK